MFYSLKPHLFPVSRNTVIIHAVVLPSTVRTYKTPPLDTYLRKALKYERPNKTTFAPVRGDNFFSVAVVQARLRIAFQGALLIRTVIEAGMTDLTRIIPSSRLYTGRKMV
jgi:hypothetical protein